MVTTRFIAATGFGGPEFLRGMSRELPALRPWQAQVEVKAAGVNPVDWRCYSGESEQDVGRLPLRLGAEVSGIVTAIGSEVGNVVVGDEVIAFRIAGGYSEHLIVSAHSLVLKPAAMSWEAASGLMLAGTTAMHAIVAIGVTRGDVVLVLGAAGGVGSLAVQIAQARGAIVIGTASLGNHDYLRSLGAIPVDYRGDVTSSVLAVAPSAVTAVIDTVGSDDALLTATQILCDRSRIATIAGFQLGRALGLRVLGGDGEPGADIRNAARQELVDLVVSGQLQVHVDSTYPIADAAAAHAKSRAGHIRGKIVLVPKPSGGIGSPFECSSASGAHWSL